MGLSRIRRAQTGESGKPITLDKKGQPAPRQQEETPTYSFFKVKLTGEGEFKDVSILQSGFLELMIDMGFRRFDTQDSFIVVRIEKNIIEEIYIHRLREILMRYMHGLPEKIEDEAYNSCPKNILTEKFLRTLETLTSPTKLALLVNLADEINDLKIVEDEKDRAFYFYKNGFVEVTATGAKLKPYEQLPGYIWKDQIIQRHFVEMPLAEVSNGVYWAFANNVAENWINDGGTPNNPRRFDSFVSITGYNLHRFFKQKLRATIFLDGRISDDPDGRSGKSLHTKAMQQILNAAENGKQAIIIDGKRYDESNRFAFDELHISTKLVVFDDLKRGFKIENFFNAIVDGLVREQKGEKNKIKILSKIIFTLNYTIQIRGGSAKDRVIEFEFADFYSNTKTPEQVHGHWFFRDWDAQEWARFDAFMMYCVRFYLQNGIIVPDTINLEARKLNDETSRDFINFMEDLEIEHEKQFNKRDLYRKFVEFDESTGKATNKDYSWLKQRLFTQWLKLWATYRPEIAGFVESRSNGQDFIRYLFNAPTLSEYLKDAVLMPGKSNKVSERVETI